MATVKEINQEVGLLETKPGEGKPSWEALAKEGKRLRIEAKKNRAAIKATTKLKSSSDDPNAADPQQEKFRRMRIEKAQQALRQRCRVFHSIMKRITNLEKQTRLRRIRKAKKVLDKFDSSERDANKAKTAIDENTETLENVQKIKVDDLVECMVLRSYKRSPVIREAFGEYECEPHIRVLSDDKTAMRLLKDVKAVNVIKAAVLAVEALIEGSNTKAAKKLAREKAKQLRKSRKELAKQEALNADSVDQDNEQLV